MLACDNLLGFIEEEETLIVLVAITGGLTLGALGIIGGTLKTVLVGRAREATRRELAAYIAEGTLHPDQAVALMNAGEDAKSGCA